MLSDIPLRVASERMNPIQREERKKARRCRSNWPSNCWAVLGAACQPPSGAAPLWPPILTAFLIALVCLPLPAPAPDLGVDTSWCAVLQWAHQHGLQFGTEIVFTYGPLGYLLAPYCLNPPSIGLILVNAALCFQIALGFSLVAWRLAPVWRVGLLLFFVLTSANAELRADLLLDTGLLCWGLLCLLESGRRQYSCAAGFILLATFAALTKVVYLFVTGFSLGAVVIFLVLGQERRLAWVILFAFAAAVLASWLGSGQRLSHFSAFVSHAFVISRDYDQAVTLGGLPLLRSWGIVLGVMAVIAVLLSICSAFDRSVTRVRLRRAVLLGWVLGLLLLVWKHSTVRLDRLHFFDLAVFAPLAAVTLEALPSPASLGRTIGRATSLICCVLSLYVIESTFLPGWVPAFVQVFSQFASHSKWLISPNAWLRILAPEMAARQVEAELPAVRQRVGTNSVDVFGFHQAYALLNNLNYRPRPVFQSYVAYNPQLARLNEEFYRSKAAPEYVLFELAGIEHRFPALDDGLALRTLLANYSPVTKEKGFLLLKRRNSAVPRLNLIQEGSVRSGERLELSKYQEQNLWLEITVNPTWRGRALKLIYRPLPVRLSVWTNSSEGLKPMARRQAAASALASGFLCSPFLLQTESVRDFYSNQRLLRPGAVSVDTNPESEHLRGEEIHYRLYRVEDFPGEPK